MFIQSIYFGGILCCAWSQVNLEYSNPLACMFMHCKFDKESTYLGYHFLQTQHFIHLLQYSDDTRHIGNGPASYKRLIERVKTWLNWSGMNPNATA